MNHLHKVVEKIISGKIAFDKRIGVDDVFEILKATVTASKSAMCFSLGDGGDYAGMKNIPSLSSRPYPICWYEFVFNDGHYGMVLEEIKKDGSAQRFFYSTDKNGVIGLSGALVWKNKNDDFYTVVPKLEPIWFQFAAHLFSVFLSAINCTNVRKVRHDPPAKLQKARKKRGKLPLLSYYTLELTGRQGPGQSLGGTHASPRVHLRRGHPRQYAPDKWTWVQPCVVGNKDLGMVRKDYAAGEKLYENHY